MQNPSCSSCFSPKANLECGLCKEALCKSCAQFLDDTSFAFLLEKPEVLAHTTYCPACYDKYVAKELEQYLGNLEKAREILVFDKSQGRETRNFKRYDRIYSVSGCADREETLLRLAFQAVQDGFNALVDVDLNSKKVRQGAYQKQIYSGTGVPTNVTGNKRWR